MSQAHQPPELPAGTEPLTPDEREALLARARGEGRELTATEQSAVFGAPTPDSTQDRSADNDTQITEMTPAPLNAAELAQLAQNFFPELDAGAPLPPFSLVGGVIFDFDETLAYPARPRDALLQEGAQAAEAFMRGRGMELPADFWRNIVEARRFAEEKSEEEREEHIADDAMSFLLQFFGYPASKLDPAILQQAVDIFYAPEMTAWRLYPHAREALAALRAAHFKIAIIANYNCDRAFQRAIDFLGLRDDLDICLCSAAVEYRKPDAAIFDIVREQWDLQPYELVVVGDSLRHDIAGALELGALAIQTTFGADAQVDFDNRGLLATVAPNATVHSLAEVPALVKAWAMP